jgi:hypothetical protein
MEILALGGLIVAAMMLFAVFGLVMLLVKGIVLLILLPVRLVFGILTLPFRLAGGLFGLLVLPIVAFFGLLLVVVGGLLAVVVPLIPVAALAGLIWLLAKSTTKPAAA